MRTYAYVDGYNLYFGLKNLCEARAKSWRWLDLRALISEYMPSEYELDVVRYFTANVRPGGKPKHLRQETFLRALRTTGTKITYGRFEIYPAEYPLSEGPDRGKYVKVNKIEEKKTDVNLASLLLIDVLIEREADAAIVVSNDSDLLYPVQELRRRGFNVGVINPHPRRPSAELNQHATFYRDVRAAKVFQCRFPMALRDKRGEFSCPDRWIGDGEQW
jgi:uncharacterized LabA/DUF88 family protein